MAVTDTQNDPNADPFAVFLDPRTSRGGPAQVGPDGQPIPVSSAYDTVGYSADPGTSGMPDMSNGNQTPQTDPGATPSSVSGSGTPDVPPVPRVARNEPAVDPATGLPNLTGDLTGPAPTPTPAPTPSTTGQDSGLEALLSQLLQSNAADRARSDAQRQSLTDTVNNTIASAERPVSTSDPEIAGPTDAFNAQGQRARRLEQEQLQQQAVAGGRTTGSTDADMERSFEDLGSATGSYQGGLMTNELNNRRSQLMAAIQAGSGILSSDTMARLQEELGTLNDKIQTQGQKNQNTQFYDQLSSGLGSQASSLDAILAEMLAQSKPAAA